VLRLEVGIRVVLGMVTVQIKVKVKLGLMLFMAKN
jgi:hypothetical protein